MRNHYTKSVKASITRWLFSLAVLTGLLTTNAYALIPVAVSGTAVTTPALNASYPDLTSALPTTKPLIGAVSELPAVQVKIIVPCVPIAVMAL